MKNVLFAICGFLGLMPAVASAHAVWIVINQEGQGAVPTVWFADGLEPGTAAYLDRLATAVVSSVDENGHRHVISVRKEVNGEKGALVGEKLTTPFVQLEAYYDAGVREPRKREGQPTPPASRSEFYAKYLELTSESKAVAANTDAKIELVPQWEGKELVIKFLNKQAPVAAAHVDVVRPGASEEELTTDANGNLRLKDVKPGQYVLHGYVEDTTPGELNGKAYGKTFRVASLVLLVK